MSYRYLEINYINVTFDCPFLIIQKTIIYQFFWLNLPECHKVFIKYTIKDFTKFYVVIKIARNDHYHCNQQIISE